MQDRPVLFDLAQLLEAGLAPVTAVRTLADNKTADTTTLTQLADDLNRGQSLAKSLNKARLASQLETEILNTAEHAGKVPEALRFVAENFARRSARIARLRSQLWMPNVVLFIALGIGVVRAVTAGSSVTGAAFKALLIAGLVVLISRSAIAYMSRDASQWLALGWRCGLEQKSRLFRRAFEQTFFTLFAWQADAGVDYSAGAKILGQLINAPAYKSAVQQYARAVSRGDGVADSLAAANLTTNDELAQVIETAEHAGRVAPALQHYLQLSNERLERTIDTIFAWIPRVYYAALLILGAWFVF